ncbi:hypothetical protein HQ346_03120 [Rhodococcus sp. BP-252]|uniref:Uncharacterized protein n=1 Tax=Rhodococcoides kyotonense TaxID=398843 RepID=A0A177Y662_9NOCA|nr:MULTISPECIES: hypothetical protein [Rhodococcus]MBY6410546.1 hypothetical protein [Rhodococcus sp. BP-320]MBY6417841.1 hypothetical protein [Rhodococcus sp. BP-321]MBY6422836.1 hypothetical protein [Rhodococcus sp. BP-324]MBY6425102.1 hypothetical protein [Rhodococcus sp. BP-323]MBY6430192.1 hypothetical protein [Rhodococcus sp. BP-322]
MSSPVQGMSVDHLLDAGAHGLQYFERNLPVLEMLGQETDWTYPELCARYDQQRGLDLTRLRADADALGRMVVEARRHVDESERLASALGQSWIGEGGVAAVEDARQDARNAADRVDAAGQLSVAMHDAADVIAASVRDKADTCGRIDDAQIDGVPASAVAAIVKYGTTTIGSGANIGIVANLDVPMLTRWLPAVADYVGERDRLDDAALRQVQELCRDWLGSVFATCVIETCAAFVDLCAGTDTAVRDALAVVAQAAEAVDASAFPTAPDAQFAPVRPASVEPAPSCGNKSAVQQHDSAPTSTPAATLPSPESKPSPSGSQMPDVRALESPSLERIPSLAEFAAVVEAAVATVADDIGEQIRAALDDFRQQHEHAAPSEYAAPLDDDRQSGDAPPAVERPETSPESADDEPSQHDSLLEPNPQPGPPPPPGLPGDGTERGHLEAELDGYHARVALAHDGTLSLNLGTPDGGSRRFELRIGPMGLPVVVEMFDEDVAPEVTPPVPETAPGQQPPAPVVDRTPVAPQPSPLPDAAPAPYLEPDSEPAPAVAHCPPEPAEPEPVPAESITGSPPPDSSSGARLVEAGPL